MMAVLLSAADNVALRERANMRTECDPSDVVGVTEVSEVSVVRIARKTTESNETHRLMFVLATDRPRFTIIALSASAARALGDRPIDARGRALAEALWLTAADEAGIDAAALTASLERVSRTGKPEAMPLRRCHISHPSARTGAEALRWWNIINFPMLGADGRVTHIVARLEDVTGTAHMQLVHDLWLQSAFEATADARNDVREGDAFASGGVSAPRALRAVGRNSQSLLLIGTREHERDRLRSGLGELGYRLLWADSEHEALTQCAQQRPDCVLLDLSASSLAGLRICRAIRELPSCAEIAILCLSSQRDAGLVDTAMLAGADDVLQKPLTPRELRAQIQAALFVQPGQSEAVQAQCRKLRRQRLHVCRLQQQRERIASFIVHDLKEPLGTIDLRAALLLHDPSLPEQARTLLERIRTQVRSALLQVLNLLDIRMLDEGRLDARCEPVDLFCMVRELFVDFDARAQARGLTLHSDVAVPQIVADPDLLRRVLANLLDNAIRHAPNNTEVSVTAHRIGAASVELRVIDGGASIPADMTERIFDMYVQSDTSGGVCRSRTGRGLGLAFCKLAVQAHRGEIGVTTMQHRTVFSIKLPENPKCVP